MAKAKKKTKKTQKAKTDEAVQAGTDKLVTAKDYVLECVDEFKEQLIESLQQFHGNTGFIITTIDLHPNIDDPTEIEIGNVEIY